MKLQFSALGLHLQAGFDRDELARVQIDRAARRMIAAEQRRFATEQRAAEMRAEQAARQAAIAARIAELRAMQASTDPHHTPTSLQGA